MTEDSNQFLHTIQKILSREMLLFNSLKNGKQHKASANNCKKEIIAATTYWGLHLYWKYMSPTYIVSWDSCNNSGMWAGMSISVLQMKKLGFRAATGFARGHPVTMNLSHDDS